MCYTYTSTSAMEDDRDKANIGTAVDTFLAAEATALPMRQPKRRFVGRRTAAERAEKSVDLQRTIEDTGAMQGLYDAANNRENALLTSIQSRPPATSPEH
jgi:hypothetical protein